MIKQRNQQKKLSLVGEVVLNHSVMWFSKGERGQATASRLLEEDPNWNHKHISGMMKAYCVRIEWQYFPQNFFEFKAKVKLVTTEIENNK